MQHPPFPHPFAADVAAFSRASSSSAAAAHVGGSMGVKKTESRRLTSFAASMSSLRAMIARMSVSKSVRTPRRGASALERGEGQIGV